MSVWYNSDVFVWLLDFGPPELACPSKLSLLGLFVAGWNIWSSKQDRNGYDGLKITITHNNGCFRTRELYFYYLQRKNKFLVQISENAKFLINQPTSSKIRMVEWGNTNWTGRLITIDLLIKGSLICKNVDNVFNFKSSWSELVSTRRSTVQSFPFWEGSLVGCFLEILAK